MSSSPIRVAAAPRLCRWSGLSAVVATVGLATVAMVGCSTAATGGAARQLVVLTADQATEVVVPAGAFDQPAPTTTEAPAAPEPTRTSEDGGATTTTGAASVGTSSTTAPVDAAATTSTTATPTTTPTTTTEAPPTKETVPLAEEDVHPGVKLMGALDDFNRCLDGEGYEWIGFPNADLGADAPVNQPGYLQALQLCNSRTQISKVYQEYQTSRADLTPDEIRQENEDFIDLADCLRDRGWTVGELRPDENGLLNPGDEFSGPDGDIVTDDIRDCVGEIALARGED